MNELTYQNIVEQKSEKDSFHKGNVGNSAQRARIIGSNYELCSWIHHAMFSRAVEEFVLWFFLLSCFQSSSLPALWNCRRCWYAPSQIGLDYIVTCHFSDLPKRACRLKHWSAEALAVCQDITAAEPCNLPSISNMHCWLSNVVGWDRVF